MTQIAFFGTGAMGEPMATNLLKKGHAVTVVKHRRSESVARLQALGAKVASSPAEAMAGRDIVVLSLPTSREVEEVIEGGNGVLERAAPGTVVVDCSTSNPASTRRLSALLQARSITLVAAGMTRGVLGAKQGTLAFFVGGPATGLEKAKPVLRAMGDTFIEFPSAADAHAAKVISNVLSYGTVALVNEALMLGAKNGVDPKTLFDALMQGASSKALESFGPRIVAGEYSPPRVTVDHVCEDMLLAQELAAGATAPIFMLGAAQEVYRLSASHGHGERDLSIVAELWRGSSRPKS
jgi:3-hydroxyisobutyrate dehydrogenase-like beta-hydroxyacid dehydrogenase